MTEILVRYGCSDCRKWFENEDDLIKVDIRPFNSRGYLPPRIDLYCKECFREREPQHRGVGIPGVGYAD